ncbi:chorismate mutase [uncultured Rothia sp.]|jgi:chorismate mutase|uniref:chorismate mutase n=1 Tax=uncultured Rothia sp. TaxID=316088 RepID=UPI0025E67FE0|nr:chorismate mutase [uncultured Rothia sp.]
MTAEHTSCEFDPHATSMGDEVAPEVYEELFAMRRSIDNFDAALVHILAERFQATKRVGLLKAKHNLPAGDPGREEAQIARLRAMAKESSLDPEFAEKFLNFIISEVIRHHIRIATEQQDSEQGENPASADHAE